MTRGRWPCCSAGPDERQAQGSHAAGRGERDPRAGAGAQQSLRARFPARAVPACWPETTRSLEDTARRLACPPFLAASHATRAGRRHGVINLLRWLSTFPGESWQQRWLTSGVEEHPGAGWVQLPLAWLAEHGQPTGGEADRLSSGLLMLICGDVIRPGLAWMLTRTHRYLASTMAHTRDPDGFARLRQLAAAGPAGGRMDGQIAATRIATLLACKGGRIDEITVGDCVELVDTQRRVQARGGQKKVDFYLRLRALGIFRPDAPATIRAFGLAGGQLSIEELVDRYRLRCTPVRDLIVDYLRERQPALDYASLDATCRTLAGLFWSKIETLAPDIDTIRLPPQIARQWKEDLATKTRTITTPDGRRVELTSPRLNATDELLRVRAFYLDIAQWAVEEPTRWGPWAVPCPIGEAEIGRTKMRQHRKSRMDQRTRERLPVLPVLVRTANERRLAAAHRLHAAAGTPPGALIPDTDGTLRRAVMATNKINGRSIWAQDTVPGRRRNLTYEEDEAFWAFAAIETLRLTGIRGEELLELTHHSITEYRLPSTGELVPLLQIAPSKTDTERLLLVSPELADVLSAIVSRLRAPNGAIPLVAAYDVRERVWNPPMPLLFQRSVGSEHRRDHPDRAAQTAAQRPRRHRPGRRRRRTTGLLPARLSKDLRHRRDHERPAAAHRADHLRAREHSDHIGLQGDLPGRGDRSPPGVHRPPPRDPPRRGIPDPHRRGMGRLPGPLREAESLHRHLRTRLRNTLRP